MFFIVEFYFVLMLGVRGEQHHNIKMYVDIMCSQVKPFSFHKIEPPSNKVETTLAELKSMYTFMFRMRRMEIAADMMYKAKLIRGFCHL